MPSRRWSCARPIQSNAGNLTVHGPDGGPRPRINFNTTASNANVAGLVFGGTPTTVINVKPPRRKKHR